MTAGWSRPVDTVPPADQVTIVCTHGGHGKVHDVEVFHREMSEWIGTCGALAEADSALQAGPYLRSPNERLEGDPAVSRLFPRVRGELPVWRGRCKTCLRAPRDARGRRTVRGQQELPGAGLVTLLDDAAAGWLPSIDLFDLANHGGRGTLDAIAAAQACVAASLAAEQQLR